MIHIESDTDGGVHVLYVYILGRLRVAIYRSTDDYRSLCFEFALAR